MIREAWALYFGMAWGVAFIAWSLLHCTPALTPADEIGITVYDEALARCRAIGLDAGKEAGKGVYLACVKEGGL